MNLRLKTDLDVETKLNELQNLLQLSSKAAVMRLAIAFSIKEHTDPRIYNGDVVHYDIRKQNGADYNRFTIYGDDELFYKLQMEESMKCYFPDEEFFPELTSAHISRGIKKLYSDVKLAGTKEKFLKKVINLKR